ncbi:putative Alpha/beta hydrolase [Bradyrhizobium vignae]|uniref:Putative Alpha/beta hydrolase n=2 Tax=Bradyrhizobium vignae TaxID=1549949 RepID=A0A2U3PUV2_9BRAD|nr:putative Alpha/beta hydrolase [Bradyrhizobium vignae]
MVTPVDTVVAGEGFKTRVLRGGSGERLLFLHGAAGANWSKFHDDLSSHYEVIITEHPGYGESADLPHVRDVAELANHYRQVLDLLRIDRVHVVASSFGGWLASELATLEAGRLKSLTLMAPTGMFPRVLEKDAPPPTRESFTRMLYFDQSIADRILARDPTEKELVLQRRNAATTARYNGQQSYDPKLGQKLQQLDIPAFIVWGENDRLVSSSHAEHWREMLNAKMCMLPNCGHLPHVELPGPTANWILSQLKQASSPEASPIGEAAT